MGILVVLHDLNLTAMYADNIAILKSGKLLYLGSPDEVLNNQSIQEIFGVTVDITSHPQYGCPLIIPHRKAYQGIS